MTPPQTLYALTFEQPTTRPSTTSSRSPQLKLRGGRTPPDPSSRLCRRAARCGYPHSSKTRRGASATPEHSTTSAPPSNRGR